LKRRSLILALAAAFSAAGVTCAFAISAAGPEMLVRLDGDYLRIALPHLDFLQGKPLERLKDGASVAFIGQVTVTTSPNSLTPAARSVARFALSYDIWEERFSVTKVGQSFDSRRSVSHLSAQAAENWCMDNLTVDRSQLPADKEFWVQLDLRTEDPRDQTGVIGDPGISITRLIEIFGRPARSAQPRWLASSGPYRLADLKRLDVRGPRG
jgi:hypothetical protein